MSTPKELFKALDNNTDKTLGERLSTGEAGIGTIEDNLKDLKDILEDYIQKSRASDAEIKECLKQLENFCDAKVNIMLVGATGCGKSSTINALFAVKEDEDTSEDEDEFKQKTPKKIVAEVAKVGSKADPETKDIEKYLIGNLVLWDTPGFGDGDEIDEHHKQVITDLLREKDEDGNSLIDLVLVILDGSTKDLGTSFKILNDVIIPELKGETNRILVALNQADIAMKTGRHWNYFKNEPDEILHKYLEEKIESIKNRIKKDTNLSVQPIYYCAGYQEEGGDVVRPYNLSKLLFYIMDSLPPVKRVPVMEGINTDSENYKCNDDEKNYNEEIKDSFYESFDYISQGIDDGVEMGKALLGIPGAMVGALIGGVVGCIKSILDEIF